MITITRYHDISCGHRVVGHEGKCVGLHGHNYRVHFTCRAEKLDALGRVIDFGVIKQALCMWLEEYWDHKMLLWKTDPMIALLGLRLARSERLDTFAANSPEVQLRNSIVLVPFNPTAENMAEYLLREIGPSQLLDTGVTLINVRIEETRKCSAEASL